MMLVGYAHVSKADGNQSPDLQRVALIFAEVAGGQIYSDQGSDKMFRGTSVRIRIVGQGSRTAPLRAFVLRSSGV